MATNLSLMKQSEPLISLLYHMSVSKIGIWIKLRYLGAYIAVLVAWNFHPSFHVANFIFSILASWGSSFVLKELTFRWTNLLHADLSYYVKLRLDLAH